MSRPIEFACPHSDDVLARHLDGHVADQDALSASETPSSAAPSPAAPSPEAEREASPGALAAHLDAHLTGCERCQQALRRARRLDAVLAHEAGQFVATQSGADGELLAAERWFAAVATTVSTSPALPTSDVLMPDGTRPDGTMPQPSRARVARSPLRAWITRLAAAAGTLAAIAWWIAGDTANRDVVATPRTESPAVAAPAVVMRGVVTPDERASAEANSAALRPAANPLLPENAPFANASKDDSAPVAVALDLRRLPKWVQPRTDAAAQPEHTRPDSARPSTIRPITSQQVANRPNATRSSAASQPDLCALRRRLDDGAVDDAQLVFCAQLAHGDLDEALRRHVRRCPQQLDEVVAALRQAARRHGTAQLLLDLWDDGVCRGRLPNDDYAAARLFAGQPAGTFQQLQHELATCAQAARRSRCLLALGLARDVDVSETLLAQLDAPRHEEALLAAFALSCLPGPVLARVAQREPTSFLLRAALLRSEADELADFRARCMEPAELRQRLRGASLPVFCELASWLRHGADASE